MNTVELIGWYGNDETHACSAWTSTSRELTPEKRGRMPSLLNSLAKDGHHTPFEKSSLHFLVKTDIATHVHLLKHRISVSINAESSRYKELKSDSFHIPDDFIGKECSLGGDWAQALADFSAKSNFLYHKCLQELTPVLGRSRAKESARFFKTYNSQIQADVMFNFRSFAHFQKLRNCEHSQTEVREVANKMLELTKEICGNPFKHTLAAFGL